MSLQTGPIAIRLRQLARRLGLTKLAGRFLQGGSYEKAFDDALFDTIGANDVIWDVGANVGYYTRKFAEAAGPQGRVIAFEPFPNTVKRLRTEVEGLSTVTVLHIALGAKVGMAIMGAGSDSLGATSRIVLDAAGEATTDVEIATGDYMLERGIAAAPTVIKIDTEGFELDVLSGMSVLLGAPSLRAIFIEVHFGILAERGMAAAPREIEKLLSDAGFNLHWVDASHVAAYRR